MGALSRKLMRFRPLLAALLFSIVSTPMLVRSQDILDSSSIPNTSAPQDFDVGNFSYSFADVGPIQSAGSMDYPGADRISWTQGTRPEDLFTVGMFTDSFGFQNLSIDQISETTGQPISESSLASFPLVQNLTVAQLAQAIPGLAQTPLSEVPPISAIAEQQGISGGTVGSVADIVQGPVGQLGDQLVNYGISEIPGLSSTSLSQLPGIDAAKISDIPGLDRFPLINPLSIKDWFVPFDIGYGMSPCNLGPECREFKIDNTASGNLENMSIPCEGGTEDEIACDHIEVRRWGPDATSKIRWISKEQKVPGGSGLGAAICDKEPTGRFPLGKNPKVVVEKIKEVNEAGEGEVELALYFSVHVDLDDSDSAHCLGPFPMPFFGSAKEGQLILFGPDMVPKNSPFAGLGGSGPAGSSGGSSGDYSGSCVASDGKTSSIYKDVNVAAFKNAISNVESRGTGGYKAIGDYVTDGDGNHGRALGKYQFMSYGPAKDIIRQKQGGQDFLSQVDSPNANVGQLQAPTDKFFTPQEQESLMDSQIRHLADVGTAQGLTGDALINRMAEMHTGGEGAPKDVDRNYSSSVVTDYKKGGCIAGSGSATGKLRFPVNASITSSYGERINPVTGEQSFHGGVDFGAGMGTPIHAADGGVVRFAGYDPLCGNMVTIDHKNGFTTTYCHMSQINTATGTPVSAGQTIGLVGTTGRSTGPHLHFGVRKNGQSVDPMIYLK
jgi:murein DD-endopeptidase MepM/ murein hydrolase activator NlpD